MSELLFGTPYAIQRHISVLINQLGSYLFDICIFY